MLILPALGIAADVLPPFTRKPVFGYRISVYSLIAVGVLSMIVWGHHMFVSGMSPFTGEYFSLATLLITIPMAVYGVNMLGSLSGGSLRADVADGLVAGRDRALRHGRLRRNLPRQRHRRHAASRHLLRRRPLPSDDWRRHRVRDVRGLLLLVPEDVRPLDARGARQGAFLGHLHSVLHGLLRPALPGPRGNAPALLRVLDLRVPGARAGTERLHLGGGDRVDRGPGAVPGEFPVEPARRSAGIRQPRGRRRRWNGPSPRRRRTATSGAPPRWRAGPTTTASTTRRATMRRRRWRGRGRQRARSAGARSRA